MSVLARFAPRDLTTQQYDEIVRRLKDAGDFPPNGMDYHCCFGSDGDLRVSEVWDSQEQMEAFRRERLTPVVAEVGTEPVAPEQLFEIHSVVRR